MQILFHACVSSNLAPSLTVQLFFLLWKLLQVALKCELVSTESQSPGQDRALGMAFCLFGVFFSEEIVELFCLNILYQVSKLALVDEKYAELVFSNLNFKSLGFQAKF